mgnify:FL=1
MSVQRYLQICKIKLEKQLILLRLRPIYHIEAAGYQ